MKNGLKGGEGEGRETSGDQLVVQWEAQRQRRRERLWQDSPYTVKTEPAGFPDSVDVAGRERAEPRTTPVWA